MKFRNRRNLLVRDLTKCHFLVGLILFLSVYGLKLGVISENIEFLAMSIAFSLASHFSVMIAWSMKVSFHHQKLWLITLYRAQAIRYLTVAVLIGLVFYGFEEMKSPQLACEFLLVFLLSYTLPVILLNIRFSEFNLNGSNVIR